MVILSTEIARGPRSPRRSGICPTPPQAPWREARRAPSFGKNKAVSLETEDVSLLPPALLPAGPPPSPAFSPTILFFATPWSWRTNVFFRCIMLFFPSLLLLLLLDLFPPQPSPALSSRSPARTLLSLPAKGAAWLSEGVLDIGGGLDPFFPYPRKSSCSMSVVCRGL